MKRLFILFFAILLVTPTASAKKSGLPVQLLNAKFVYVTNYPGDGVRRGRAVGAGLGPSISIGEKGPNSTTIGERTQAEVGPAEDMIVVFAAGVDQKSNPRGAIDYDAPALWRLIQHNALQSPSVPGLQQLRKEIERAETENAKKK
jgi:hypothetical protein